MAEQECRQEKLQRLEVEDKQKVAEQEAAVLARHLQGEKEGAECRIEREKQEVALLKKEDAARQKSVKDFKRDLERLEELKKLNAARARLQVYDGDEFPPDKEHKPLNSEMPRVMEAGEPCVSASATTNKCGSKRYSE